MEKGGSSTRPYKKKEPEKILLLNLLDSDPGDDKECRRARAEIKKACHKGQAFLN